MMLIENLGTARVLLLFYWFHGVPHQSGFTEIFLSLFIIMKANDPSTHPSPVYFIFHTAAVVAVVARMP